MFSFYFNCNLWIVSRIWCPYLSNLNVHLSINIFKINFCAMQISIKWLNIWMLCCWSKPEHMVYMVYICPEQLTLCQSYRKQMECTCDAATSTQLHNTQSYTNFRAAIHKHTNTKVRKHTHSWWWEWAEKGRNSENEREAEERKKRKWRLTREQRVGKRWDRNRKRRRRKLRMIVSHSNKAWPISHLRCQGVRLCEGVCVQTHFMIDKIVGAERCARVNR